jgi:predicted Zn-dependent protease|tara:strand:- start:6771 stop:7517 length:747 start_codon:yes stop_codon:yes gene_type:complete
MCGGCIFTRRRFLALSAVGAATGLASCDEFSLVSDDEVHAMGLQAWREISDRTPVSTDPEATRIVGEVAERVLFAVGEPRAAWQIELFSGSEANAFALPGNRIGVFEGLLQITENRAQLAAIIGHEIGHVKADHSQERISAALAKEHGINIVSRLMQLGEVEFAEEMAAALGLGLEFGVLLPYSRRHELEADAYGVDAMRAAGYDPKEAVKLWRNMDSALSNRTPEILATHPAPASRIEQIEEMIAKT